MKKQNKSKELVVFSIIKESQCNQCKSELFKGDFLLKEEDQALCLNCADLDHLVFLPSGDAALTRRSKKHSSLYAVVVKFSRTRKRYERQGLLVQERALNKAEEECEGDKEARAQRRECEVHRREKLDTKLVKEMSEKIKELFPGIALSESQKIAVHTALRGSGRVGRSEAGRNLDENALNLAVMAHIRHCHTKYDEHLMKGYERSLARSMVSEKIAEVMESWCN